MLVADGSAVPKARLVLIVQLLPLYAELYFVL